MKQRETGTRLSPTRFYTALGVAALAIIATIGYVAYTANSGLPFQQSYEVTVEVPSANRLVPTNDVRIAGIRVGQVSRVEATIEGGGGPPYASVELKLAPSAGPLPVDTAAKVASSSVLGATYLDLAPGGSRRMIPSGGTLPIRRSTSTVDLTDLFDVFRTSTARHFQDTVDGLAGGFAGRGPALNRSLGSISESLPRMIDLARLLASKTTQLREFLSGYESTMDELGAVSPALGKLVDGAATTFDALAGARPGLAEAIDAAPGAESATTRAFSTLEPGLADLAKLMTDLRPAGRILPATLQRTNSALHAGVRPMRQFPSLNTRLRTALTAVDQLARDPSSDGAVRKLTDLLAATDETTEVLAPAQKYCNVIGIWAEGFASTWGTIGTGEGPPLGNVGLEQLHASGEMLQNKKPSPDVAINYLPNENKHECESGNEPYNGKQSFNSPPGRQSGKTRDTAPPAGVRARADSVGLLNGHRGNR